MAIRERVNSASRLGDGGLRSTRLPIETTPEVLRGQAESWRKLGEKVGSAVKQMTGKNIFEPDLGDEGGKETMGWEAIIAEPNPHYDYRIIYLKKKVPEGTHFIAASYGSLIGLKIVGSGIELDELDLGQLEPKESTQEEIKQAFARSIINPLVLLDK